MKLRVSEALVKDVGRAIARMGPEDLARLSSAVGDIVEVMGKQKTICKARQAAPCIVFFDEIDALLPSRSAVSGDSHVAERVLSQFLTELDGLEELKGVLVLAATNRLDMLDPAVLRPGRLSEIIEVPLPDAKGRTEIFQVHLRNKPVAAGGNGRRCL